jgi:hypothetical protein
MISKKLATLFENKLIVRAHKSLEVCKAKPKNSKNRSGAKKAGADSEWRKRAAKQRQKKGVNKCQN